MPYQYMNNQNMHYQNYQYPNNSHYYGNTQNQYANNYNHNYGYQHQGHNQQGYRENSTYPMPNEFDNNKIFNYGNGANNFAPNFNPNSYMMNNQPSISQNNYPLHTPSSLYNPILPKNIQK